MRENKQYLSSWGWVTSFNISSSICFLESCILVFSLQKNKTVYMCYVFISLSLESRLILFPYCCAQSSNKHRQASIFVVGYIVLWVYSPAMVWLDHMQDLLLLAFWETSTLLHMLIYSTNNEWVPLLYMFPGFVIICFPDEIHSDRAEIETLRILNTLKIFNGHLYFFY